MNPFLIIQVSKLEQDIEALPRVHASRCVLFDEQGNVVMVSLDSEHEGYGRVFGIPGGKVEDGEDFAAACIREVREESGFVIDTLQPIGEIALVRKGYVSISHGYIAHVVFADKQELMLMEDELAVNFDVHSVPIDEAIEILTKQYIEKEKSKAATLRNLTFIMDAKRIIEQV